MNDPFDALTLGRLIRQRGIPAQPEVAPLLSEVRSDCAIILPKRRCDWAQYLIELVLIVWRFRLSLGMVEEFHRFLADNERFIADSCEKELNGVHYRGTYMALNGERAAYTTIWAYDSWEAQGEWAKLLANKRSRLYKAIRDLRSYWAADPDGTQVTYGGAACIDVNQGFFGITLDAGTQAPPAPARRQTRPKSTGS